MEVLINAPAIRNVIFAGGGSRCFWQVGFWDGLVSRGVMLHETVACVGSTSAGGAMATAAVLGRTLEALTLFKEMSAANPSNLHWNNLLVPGAPILPHARMYRRALETFVRPADLDVLKQKTFRFLMADYPRLLPGMVGAVLGFAIYAAEKRFGDPVHPVWSSRAGFRAIIGEASACRSVAEFVDLALAASCVPPVLPGGRYAGKPVLDGGLIDNVPLLLAADQPGQTLVLLSKRYSHALPVRDNTTYAQPSTPITLSKFDYANPQGLQEVYDLGYRDAQSFVFTAGAALS